MKPAVLLKLPDYSDGEKPTSDAVAGEPSRASSQPSSGPILQAAAAASPEPTVPMQLSPHKPTPSLQQLDDYSGGDAESDTYKKQMLMDKHRYVLLASERLHLMILPRLPHF
jgi:hypothetical protein